jgi:hypothetical protein
VIDDIQETTCALWLLISSQIGRRNIEKNRNGKNGSLNAFFGLPT